MLKAAIRRARRLDATRGFTTAVNTGWDGDVGFIEHADVHGINYFGNGDIDALRRVRPDVPVILSEGASAICTRGAYADDPDAGYVAAYDDHTPPPAHPQLKQWPHWAARPATRGARSRPARLSRAPSCGPASTTAASRRPTIAGPAPARTSASTTAAGSEGRHVVLQGLVVGRARAVTCSRTGRAGREGQPIDVWAYSNAASVKLFCNGRWCGERRRPAERPRGWAVPYEPGELSAVAPGRTGRRRGLAQTTGPAVGLRLERAAPELRLPTLPVPEGDPR